MRNLWGYLLVFIISLIIVSIISTLFSFLFLYTLHIEFYKIFIICFIVQFITYPFIYHNSSNNTNKTNISQNNIQSPQIVQLTCEKCKKQVLVPIDINEKNEFTCPYCESKNSILITFTVAYKFEPKMAKIDIEIPKEFRDLNVTPEQVQEFLTKNTKNIKTNDK